MIDEGRWSELDGVDGGWLKVEGWVANGNCSV